MVLVKQNMSQPISSSFIFAKYWEVSKSFLTMTKLNEMVQAHRDNEAIVLPLLKIILILASNEQSGLDADSSDSAGDILNLLTSSIA